MKQFNIFLLTAALTLTWGCSSDSYEDTLPEKDNASEKTADVVETDSVTYPFTASDYPDWAVDWSWNDEAPLWQAPEDASVFESRMYVCLSVSYDLLPYISERDKVAIFVGDECRGVASPYIVSDYSIYFNVIVLGNHSDSEYKMTIKFYCDSMKQIFVLDGFYSFMPEITLGADYSLDLELGEGSPKYSPSFLTVKIASTAPVAVEYRDVIAVFINGECRGLGKPNEEFMVWLDKDVDHVDASAIELRYYNVEKGGYYTIPSTASLERYNFQEIWLFNKN